MNHETRSAPGVEKKLTSLEEERERRRRRKKPEAQVNTFTKIGSDRDFLPSPRLLLFYSAFKRKSFFLITLR